MNKIEVFRIICNWRHEEIYSICEIIKHEDEIHFFNVARVTMAQNLINYKKWNK